MSLECLFDGRMSWREAWLLANELACDPSSRVAAAVNGWRYPFTHEAKILADLYDLTITANTDKKKRGRIKPYPRPWKVKGQSHRSTKPSVDQDTVRAALAARGH